MNHNDEMPRDRSWRSDPKNRFRALTIVWAAVVLALLLAAVSLGISDSSYRTASANNRASLETSGRKPPVASTATSNLVTTGIPSDLPQSCGRQPILAPVSPPPTWPGGYEILDSVPNALAEQYPTVFGGLIVAPAKPGESQAEINSHFILLEKIRDPALESEAKKAYPLPITVQFEISPNTSVCLNDVDSRVSSAWQAAESAGITVIGDGIGVDQIVVDVTACKPSSELAAKRWFSERWGALVTVTTCNVIPIAGVQTMP
jgi:hypothetical protein